MHVEPGIIGAGQAGLAQSRTLGAAARPRMVLERAVVDHLESYATGLDEPVHDAHGALVHREGVAAMPGLFALGLRFQHTRRSHFLGGVDDDAALVARAIAARAPGARMERVA